MKGKPKRVRTESNQNKLNEEKLNKKAINTVMTADIGRRFAPPLELEDQMPEKWNRQAGHSNESTGKESNIYARRGYPMRHLTFVTRG